MRHNYHARPHKTYEARKRQKWREKVIQGQTGPFKAYMIQGHKGPHKATHD